MIKLTHMVDYINLELNNLPVVMRYSKISQITELENLFADMQELMLEMEAINYEAADMGLPHSFYEVFCNVLEVADRPRSFSKYFNEYTSKLATKGREVNEFVETYLKQLDVASQEEQDVVLRINKWLSLLNNFCQKSELLTMTTVKLEAMLTATLLNCVDVAFVNKVAESNTVTPATEGSDSDIDSTGDNEDDAS